MSADLPVKCYRISPFQTIGLTGEEMSLGACSVAVPVRVSDDRVVAALGIVVSSLKRDRARLVAALQAAAQGIGRSVGG
ncbi:IclR family transcriptional regulator domain-containing protein [Aeromicrobium wangtongii]|uniref:IclR family transcriptional regulator domain-containing protein n=1 Tax=Aeromicrobium wangtongii TaxID=2969247 RepID=UPI003FD6FC46